MNSQADVRTSVSLVMVLIVVVVSFFAAFSLLNLPEPKPDSIPKDEFSAERAYNHLIHIATNAHSCGTVENTKVKEYILSVLTGMNLQPTVQDKKMQAENARWGVLQLNNILCRIPGTDPNGKAVMLVAHYDSMPTGPGAMDDGSGVAILLETARAITSGKPVKNDIILLFTDGEEPGLLGAKAFAEDYGGVLNNVAVAANFDAGGSSGPVILVDTSSGNERMMLSFLKNTTVANAYSSLVEFTKFVLPGTDMRVFGKPGVKYMNFIVVMDKENIHTAKDNVAVIGRGTLQQQGEYVMAFCQTFGDTETWTDDIDINRNAVFFPIIGGVQVSYGQLFSFLLVVIVLLACAVAFAYAIKRKIVTVVSVGRAVVLFSLCAAVSGLSVWIIVNIARYAFRYRTNNFFGFEIFLKGSDFNDLTMVGLVLLTFFIFSAAIRRFLVKNGYMNLLFGSLLFMCIPAAVTSLFFVGLSYLFIWPTLCILVAMLISRMQYEGQSIARQTVVAALLIYPCVVLYFPVIYFSYPEGIDKAPLLMLLLSFPLSVFLPYLMNVAGGRSRTILSASGIAIVLLILGGIVGFALQ